MLSLIVPSDNDTSLGSRVEAHHVASVIDAYKGEWPDRPDFAGLFTIGRPLKVLGGGPVVGLVPLERVHPSAAATVTLPLSSMFCWSGVAWLLATTESTGDS